MWEALERCWQPRDAADRRAAARRCAASRASPIESKRARGRKRDFPDAERLVKRLVAQELTLSFVPDADAAAVADRDAAQVSSRRATGSSCRTDWSACSRRAHIKLSSLVSDLLGASARRMLQALATAKRTRRRGRPRQSAAPRDAGPIARRPRRMHGSPSRLRDCSRLTLEELERDRGAHRTNSIRRWRSLLRDHQEAVQRLADVPGLGVDSAQQIIAEVGPTAATFPTAKHLASWVGACPGDDESAGVNHSHRSPKGNRQMRRLLNQAANAAVKTKGSIFELVYRRLVLRLGHAQAIGAIAHRLCRLIWKILHDGVRYEERGPAVTKHRRNGAPPR